MNDNPSSRPELSDQPPIPLADALPDLESVAAEMAACGPDGSAKPELLVSTLGRYAAIGALPQAVDTLWLEYVKHGGVTPKDSVPGTISYIRDRRNDLPYVDGTPEERIIKLIALRLAWITATYGDKAIRTRPKQSLRTADVRNYGGLV